MNPQRGMAMRPSPWFAAAAAAALTLSAAPASAQMIPRSVEIDLGGGYYWFADPDAVENLQHSGQATVRLGLHFSEYIGFEASLDVVPTLTSFSNQWTPYLINHYDLVMHLTNWQVVPYIAVGAGLVRWDITRSCKDGACTGDPESWPVYGSHAEPNLDFAFDAGVGVKFLPTQRFGLRIDGRYILSLGPGGQDYGVPDLRVGHEGEYNDQFNHVSLTGSVFFLAGGSIAGKDKDGDGIPDKQDACKDAAEDKDGFQDSDGCPDNDNDNDGIWDTQDKCPNDAEDKDRFQDSDGCPEADNDNDGIGDGQDQCPDQPEDRDGYKDQDGCPEEDNDGDGIPDGQDQCPTLPEEVNGIQDTDGCPENDDDNDGVLDTEDKCPRDQEDRDGFEDSDGCPETDNDKDGVSDANDKCPDVPEDPDGFEDTDGCPDRDNDGDSILDADDKCPNAAETLNSFEDRDGCPDEIPKQLEKFVGVIRGIQFKVNSDELLPSSFAILNEAASVLTRYKDTRMEIQGHASAEGDAEHNLLLSQARAESVRNYLISRGIDPARLVAIGYGITQPIAPNDDETGRSMNRRVEFKILDPAP